MAREAGDSTNSETGSVSRSKWWRIILFGVPISSAAILFAAGIIFWGGFNTAMEATNTLGFCISCHEMEENVYQEYTHTIHFQNRTGVRATCSDCHVPDPWVHKFVRKIQASNELIHKVLGSVNTPEKFDAKRLAMAKKVWRAMKTTDSRECRNCHNFESMAPEFQRPRARKQHLNAFESGQTCIDCHKGIAHKNVRDQLTEEELETLEMPDPAYQREVPAAYLESLARVEKAEAEAAEAERLRQEAADAEIAGRIESAVAAAIAAERAKAEAPADDDGDTAAGGGSGEDISGVAWADVASQTITLFYPGQTSFEWAQTGKDHGGARAFAKLGDRCASCHANEVRDMGAKLVSGEKAEDSPIPGKRGHVDLKVQAVHDDNNLYMRFQWPDAAHTPAPFVDGGKMDPDNQVKLAMMIAGTGIDNADQAGCWVTCHHDSRFMPDQPDDTMIAEAGDVGNQIDITDGITKYTAQSRTKVEIKGRRGKKRGGWDKLKPAAEIDELAQSGAVMDLVRYLSGSSAENGSVLAERQMADSGKIDAQGSLENGTWTVVLTRPLAADSPGDVPIKAGELYTVGFALHDDFTNARFHHVSLEFKLGLDDPNAEINVTARK